MAPVHCGQSEPCAVARDEAGSMLDRISMYSIAESLSSDRARHAQGRMHIKVPCEGPRHNGFAFVRGASQ